MPDNDYDWADDDSLSAEETMRIFESLGPDVEITGPHESAPAHVPTPGELMAPQAPTFASSVTQTKDFPHVGVAEHQGIAIRPKMLLTA
jgi:hypothetical protein